MYWKIIRAKTHKNRNRFADDLHVAFLPTNALTEAVCSLHGQESRGAQAKGFPMVFHGIVWFSMVFYGFLEFSMVLMVFRLLFYDFVYGFYVFSMGLPSIVYGF